ncbi:uncharacterized protein LOC592911 [Strongylocentrotus purpuratus]|uniref:Uncharacterized protein n=1 Tax=Strongylocentrotus purpuratus TaxID=7668 RepID=A0A7M7RFY6_STRPU|nr:uncharacterized protein LOC592911 [Strongylocentrotus purpuratus]|eukprot:XP_800732.2 PREDICTED: uncharacterized protein LOC592911 [Strongylocentrotus purpuratus]
MGVMRYVPIAILMSVLVTSSVQQHGRQLSNCVWEYDDGQTLDLTSAGNTDGTARWNNVTALDVNQDPNLYTINPCYGFTLGTECAGVAVCRISNMGIPLNVAATSSGRMYYSEADNGVVLEYNHTDPSDPDLVYISRFQSACNGGEEVQIVVLGAQSSTPNQVIHRFILLLTCASTIVTPKTSVPPTVTPQPIITQASPVTQATIGPHTVTHVTIGPPPVTKVTIGPPPFTPATVRPHPETHGLTAGGVICIIFVSCVCGYFLIGSFYMCCCSGAKGLEIIPHVHFWLDLPTLILEGFFFLFSCCGKTQLMETSSGQDYDKI